jgi:hypothetical protein
VTTVAAYADLMALLRLPQPPEEITLSPGYWPCIEVRSFYPSRVTIYAHGCTVSGLHIRGGGNFVWIGGQIEAPDGPWGSGHAGYAVSGIRARDVLLKDVTITNAKKGIVWDGGSERLLVEYCRFVGRLVDGIILNGGPAEVIFCTFAFSVDTSGVHQDCVQWFGSKCRGPFRINHNLVNVRSSIQGIGGLGARPMGIPVEICRNIIQTDAPRAISVAREVGLVANNIIGRGKTGGPPANIIVSDPKNPRPPGMALVACDNVAQDFAALGRPLPDWAQPRGDPVLAEPR